ncbi:M20 family metallopeptidase [Cytobacillus oceanisediminis]|uniref:M20 family metallopeptidase n=1 Tax=Cytobacillus oceanisediminis TaxID=665099 RepID=UPI0037365D15
MNQHQWVNNFIEKTRDQWIATSDKIWENPETRFEEYVSAEILSEQLEREGFRVTKGIAGIETAFVGEFGEGKPVIAFLGEYDALSGMSQKGNVAYKEKNIEDGNGHGCGHNLLGTGALAGAVALKTYMEEHDLKGTVRFYGCPGEEGGSGKTFMAREGIFDDVDMALCWHPGPHTGVIASSFLSNIQAYFKFKGTSSHAAASPHLGRSALDAVELMNVGVNYLREHVIPEARIHYAITNTGGISPNVVQANAEVLYLIRAPQIDETKEIYERIKKIAEGAALMSETEVEVIFDKACSNYIPSKVLGKTMYESMLEVGLPEFSNSEQQYAKEIWNSLTENEKNNAGQLVAIANEKVNIPSGQYLTEEIHPKYESNAVVPGSSDVGDVSWIAPTVQCMMTTCALGTALHSWQMVAQGTSSIAHKGLLQVSKVLALTAIKALENKDIIENAKKELLETLNDTPYECPIPADVQPSKLN